MARTEGGDAEPVLRGVREVARFLRLRHERVASLLASGEIPSRRVGKARIVSTRAVLAWLESPGRAEQR